VLNLLYVSLGWTPHDRRFVAAAASRNRVTVARIVPGGEEVDLPGVRILELGGAPRKRSFCSDDLERIPALERLLAETAPDIVQAGPLTSAGWIAAVVGGPPLVAVSWGFDLLEEARENEAARWVARLALRRASAILCDSRVVREAVVAECPETEPERIFTFPWGVDGTPRPPLDEPSPVPVSFRRRFGRIVVAPRAWETHYGVEVVLEAFEIARSRRGDLGLVLAGGGSRASWVRDYVGMKGLDDAVFVSGRVREAQMAALCEAADIYLSCVPSDGSSVTLMGAMAAGIPVIAADAPGNREWVLEGKTGLLAPAGDAAAFADRILRVASWTPEALVRCRETSRKIVHERARWKKHTETLHAVYEKVARGDLPRRDGSMQRRR
jgi:glycosyltransferase involved in cell wall biosynthesis